MSGIVESSFFQIYLILAALCGAALVYARNFESMSQNETVEIGVEQLADHAVAVLWEMPERDNKGERHFKTFWDSEYDDDILDDPMKIIQGVETADVDGYLVTFSGSYVVEVVVGMIPAGPNRGYGPINPPEAVTEEVDVFFDLTLDLTDLGTAYIEMEADCPRL